MTIGETFDRAFLFTFGLGAVMLFLITAVMLFFVFKYSRKRNKRPRQVHGSLPLELTWTILPTALVLVIFWYGYRGYRAMRTVPQNAVTVKCLGQKWFWTFTYPDGRKDGKLYVKLHQPVKLEIESKDVLHSAFIPAFHVKQDAVPGMKTYLWFQADEEGEYDFYCAEYCGDRHAYMITKVVALNPERFADWEARRGEFAPQAHAEEPLHPGLDAKLVAKGKELFTLKACASCHSTDGSKLVGPSLKEIWGHDVLVVKGGAQVTVKVDEGYFRRAIYEPDAEVVDGFAPGVMPSQKGSVSEEELKALAEYIKSLE